MPEYLNYVEYIMQNARLDEKLESGLPGQIATISDIQIPL